MKLCKSQLNHQQSLETATEQRHTAKIRQLEIQVHKCMWISKLFSYATGMYTETANYHIVPGKCPYPRKRPPPNFDSFMAFKVLRVTAHHAKLSEAHIAAIVLMRFGHHDIRCQRFTHTCPYLVCSVLPLHRNVRILQAMTERCENLPTRLQVSLLCSTIQRSPLLGWPRRSMDEPHVNRMYRW